MIVRSLHEFYRHYGDDLKVECPTGSGDAEESRRSRRRRSPPAVAHLPARSQPRRSARGLGRATTTFRPTRTGATTFRSTSISTATPAPASGRAIKRAGRALIVLDCCTKLRRKAISRHPPTATFLTRRLQPSNCPERVSPATTSSSSAAAPAAARWPAISPPPARRSCCSNGATGSDANRELECRGGLRRQPLRLARHLVRQARQGVPTRRPLLRRRRHEDVRRRPLSAAPGRLRRAATSRRRLAGVADQLRRARAVLPTSRGDVPRPRRPRRRSDRAAVERTVSALRRSRTNRGSRSWPTTSPAPATIRSTRRAASCSTKRKWRSAAACAAWIAMASPASCTRRATPKSLAVRPALEFPNVTLLTNAMVHRLRDERDRPRGDARRRHARREAGRVRPAASSSSPAAPPTRRSCC